MILPRLIYITNRHAFAALKDFLHCLKENLKGGVRGIYLREKDLEPLAFYELVQRVHGLCADYDAQLILPANCAAQALSLANGLQAGKHTADLTSLRAKWGKDFSLGYSAHALEEAQDAELLMVDYFFFSPIFSTASKPDLQPLGQGPLRAFVQASPLPVFALGGITPENAAAALNAGAYGLAVLSALQGSDRRENLAHFNEVLDHNRPVI